MNEFSQQLQNRLNNLPAVKELLSNPATHRLRKDYLFSFQQHWHYPETTTIYWIAKDYDLPKHWWGELDGYTKNYTENEIYRQEKKMENLRASEREMWARLKINAHNWTRKQHNHWAVFYCVILQRFFVSTVLIKNFSHQQDTLFFSFSALLF